MIASWKYIAKPIKLQQSFKHIAGKPVQNNGTPHNQSEFILKTPYYAIDIN